MKNLYNSTRGNHFSNPKKILLSLIFFLSFSLSSYSQGTFVSITDGDWNDVANWQDSSGSDGDGIPDADDNVTIEHDITLSSLTEVSQIYINAGASLDILGYEFNVHNYLQVGEVESSGIGTLTNSSSLGGSITIFGILYIAKKGVFENAPTESFNIFQNGFTNDGVLTALFASFDTNDQNLSGSGNTTIYEFEANVVNVTNSSGHTLKVINSLSQSLDGGSFTNYGTLEFGGASIEMSNESFDASFSGNTVVYNGTEAQSVLDVIYNNLILINGTDDIKYKNLAGNITVNTSLLIDNAFLNLSNSDIYLYGNLFLQNSGFMAAADGLLRLEGSNLQQISADNDPNPSYLVSTIVNNFAGIELLSDIYFDGNINLENGYIYLGDNNLYFTEGRKIESVEPFNSNRMIITNGEGNLNLYFSSSTLPITNTHEFPLGTFDGVESYNYTPIDISLTSFTDGYISARAISGSDYDLGDPSRVLSKYWYVKSEVGNSIVGTMEFIYEDGEINGVNGDDFYYAAYKNTGDYQWKTDFGMALIDNNLNLITIPIDNNDPLESNLFLYDGIDNFFTAGEFDAFDVSPEVEISSVPSPISKFAPQGTNDLPVYRTLIKSLHFDNVLSQIQFNTDDTSNSEPTDFTNFRLYTSTDSVFSSILDNSINSITTTINSAPHIQEVRFENFSIQINHLDSIYLFLVANVTATATPDRNLLFINATNILVNDTDNNLATINNYAARGDTFIVTSSSVAVRSDSMLEYDFEADNGGFVSESVVLNNSWEWGTPAKNTIIGDSHLGASDRAGKAWMTGLNTPHTLGEESYVRTPIFDLGEFIGTNTSPYLKLDVFMDGELGEGGADIAYIEYSFSGEEDTWNYLSSTSNSFNNPNWYTEGLDGGNRTSSTNRTSKVKRNSGWLGTFDDWKTQGVELTDEIVNNRFVQFRIYFLSASGDPSTYDGVAFDNFRIGKLDNYDLGVIDLYSPNLIVPVGEDVDVQAQIKNYGAFQIGSFDVKYQIEELSISNEESFTQLINPFGTPSGETSQGDYTFVSFTNPLNFTTAGEYTLKLSTNLSGEEYSSNDDFEATITAVNAVTTFPYVQDFEVDNGSWSTDDATLWQYGATTKVTSSGNAWATLLTGNYPEDKEVSLYTPYFNTSDLDVEAAHYLSFEYYHDFNQGDYVTFEYTTDGENWYEVWDANNFNYVNFYGNSEGLGIKSFSINNYIGDILQFRFRFVSDTDGNVGEGFVLKNFRIGEQIELTVKETALTSGFIGTGSVDNIVYGFDMTATGGDVNVYSFSGTFGGNFLSSDITEFKIYTTTTNVFDNSNLVYSISGASFNTNLEVDLTSTPIEIAQDQTVYVWIACDIDATASIGQVVQIYAPISINTTNSNVYVNNSTDDGEAFTIIQASDVAYNGGEYYGPISDYYDYFGADITNVNSLKVLDIRIDDFGYDGLPTVLNSLTLNVQGQGATSLRRVALYDGNGIEIAEISGGGNVLQFNNLNFEADDDHNSSNENPTIIEVRVTFNTSVTDNSFFQFQLVSASVNNNAIGGTSPLQQTITGGTSTIDDAANRFDVVASRIGFSRQPDAELVVNTVLTSQPALVASDNFGNVDLNFSNIVLLSTQGGIGFSPVPQSFSAGRYTLSNFYYTSSGNGTLIATSVGFTTTSSSVNVVGGAPSIALSNTTFTHQEGGAETNFLTGLVMTDDSNLGPSGAYVRFINNFETGDTLVYDQQIGIATYWYSTTNTLQIVGTVNEQTYLNIINSMRFYTKSHKPLANTRSLEFYVVKGAAESNRVSVNINVIPVNDAPVLNPSATAGYQDAVEEQVLTASAQYFINQAQSVYDLDLTVPSQVFGIAISNIDETVGTWEYSLDGGATFDALSGLSLSNALLLTNNINNLIRFIPSLGVTGDITSILTFFLWDGTDNKGNGSFGVIDNSTASAAYSTNSQDIDLLISAINDAPSFEISTTEIYIEEDAGLQTIEGFAFNISDGDEDLQQNLEFRANVTILQGNLTFEKPSGIDVVTGDLTFEASPNTSGTAEITLYLIDGGGTLNGGDNSSEPVVFYINVGNVNDDPDFNPSDVELDVFEDEVLELTVADIYALVNISDEDANSQKGLVFNQFDTEFGVWEYTIDGGTNWIEIDGSVVADENALVLTDESTNLIRFTPIPEYYGLSSPAFSFRAWDVTDQLIVGDFNDITGSIGISISDEIQTVGINVISVNDNPDMTFSDADIEVLEDEGLIEIEGFVTVDDGEAEEEQAYTITVSDIESDIDFIQEPFIDEFGVLSFEADENANGFATVFITVEDELGGSDFDSFTIAVIPVNDEPYFELTENEIVLEENFEGEYIVDAALIGVPFDEDNEEVIFTIEPEVSDLVNVEMDELTGTITFTAIDNAFGEEMFIITADDGQEENNIYSDTLYVAVVNLNEEPTDILISNETFKGNPRIGTSVGVFETEDLDEDDIHTYTLVSGAGDDDNDKFVIEGDELLTNARFNYRDQNIFSIRVQTDDGQGGILEKEFELSMNIPTVNPADSVALATLQEFIDNVLPWELPTPVYEWEGTIIEDESIISLDLSGFELDSIDIESILALSELSYLDISNNNLTFGYIEPLIDAQYDTFIYAPQGNVDEEEELFEYVRSKVVFYVTTTGKNDQFQWFKNDILIQGANADSLKFEEVLPSDTGIYTCKVTNPKAPNLTLFRSTIELNVVLVLNQGDKDALLEINKLRTNEGGRVEGWDLDKSPYTWDGVVIEIDRVVELNLSEGGFSGELPSIIENLTQLRRLDLFGNDITSLPTQIGLLTSLEYLDLDDNNLTTLPNEIGNLTSLKTVWLARNNLTSLPNTISNWTKIENLFLQDNFLKTLPTGFTTLTTLQVLDISQNELTSMPSLSNFNNLRILRLNDNILDETNTSFTGLSNLEEINLDDNNYKVFPFTLSEFTKLKTVSMRRNYLTFEDLEDKMSVSFSFNYAPQKRGTPDEKQLARIGDRLEMSLLVGGTQNQYTWYRDGIELSNSSNSTYTINNVQAFHAGFYEARVTNSLVPNLILETKRIELEPSCAGTSITLSVDGSLVFCQNEPISTKLKSSSNAGVEYRWYRNGQELLLANGAEYNALLEGTYQLRMKEVSGCISVSNNIEIKINPLPTVSIEQTGDFELVANGASGTGIYQWYKDGVAISGATNSTYKVETRGTYVVSFTNSNNCIGYSEAKILNITPIDEPELEEIGVSLYPNPNSGTFELNIGNQLKGKVMLYVINASGTIISTEELDTQLQSQSMDYSTLPSGVYFLKVQSNEKTVMLRMTKQ